jgi:RNA polymerase sigma-70 factor (ECF subfamily)
MATATTDEELMLAYKAGDARAFEILYTRHKDSLYRYLLRQCRVAAVAEELFQDAWMSLIRARERYEPRAKLTTYLYRIAHNHLIDYYRRHSSGVPISYDDDPEELTLDQLSDAPVRDAAHDLDAKRQVRQLLGLIDELPESQREAFLLREESGLSVDEIADVTGVTMETAKSRLRYAVEKLRCGMQEKPHANNAESATSTDRSPYGSRASTKRGRMK